MSFSKDFSIDLSDSISVDFSMDSSEDRPEALSVDLFITPPIDFSESLPVVFFSGVSTLSIIFDIESLYLYTNSHGSVGSLSSFLLVASALKSAGFLMGTEDVLSVDISVFVFGLRASKTSFNIIGLSSH